MKKIQCAGGVRLGEKNPTWLKQPTDKFVANNTNNTNNSDEDSSPQHHQRSKAPQSPCTFAHTAHEMSFAASRQIATRALAQASRGGQRRTIIDYLTNYPDKVNEMKKIQCAGGVRLGEKNPTWLKQPTDKFVAGIGFLLGFVGTTRIAIGMWRLATGKGKID
eukprot:CAMPEP_0198133580 /NCGR_PEP_ID=MMETSP1442-20131203/59634_1 /TAXON_ID= /ORGANISM="Craspedostauros australis, Strain CCMP3328" /LENGTH=162 /DNA_ID=CAMNT_0043794705 /DNA_START=391 /DNA_END=879 /DNA_ORIENTATION=+